MPIRQPGDFDVIVRAKALPDGLPFDVELMVNGETAGRAEATPRWQEYHVRGARGGTCARGLNDFLLRFRPPDAGTERAAGAGRGDDRAAPERRPL